MLEKKDQLKMQKLMNKCTYGALGKSKKRIITHPMQEVAVDILTELFFEEPPYKGIEDIYDKYFEKYALCKDPFTNMPCTTKEWAKNSLEYQRQIMDEKYGHHDGLE